MLAGEIHHSRQIPACGAAGRIALIPPLGDKRDVMRLAPELCPPSWERVGCQATDVWGRIDPDQPSNTIRCTFQNPSKGRSEEHTSELQSLMRISYAVFCLKKKKLNTNPTTIEYQRSNTYTTT